MTKMMPEAVKYPAGRLNLLGFSTDSLQNPAVILLYGLAAPASD
jgi:hypothetical protein